jgi:DNA polymerase-3 subunit alpha
MKKSEDFVHLHVHSDMSQLDGCGLIGDYVAEAKLRGNPAIAFTEHGTMRGYLQLRKEAEKREIKPIYGIEFYVSRDMHRKGVTPEEKAELLTGIKRNDQRATIRAYEDREGIRDRWHTTVWALTQEGMLNLQRLSSKSYIEGFYYKPRVDLAALCEHNEGLAISTGCLNGPAHDSYLQGRRRYAIDFVDKLHEAFGDRMYLEIQPHAIADQARVNEFELTLRERTGCKLLATQDAHYVKPEDSAAHDLMLCIGTGAKLTDADRFRFDGDEFYFRTRAQMRDAFVRHHGYLRKSHIKEALDSTVELASRSDVKIEIDYLRALLPSPGMPDKYKGDEFRFLKDLCLDGWTWRGIPARARGYAHKHGIGASEALQRYAERLKLELAALKRQKLILYFLVVRDVYTFARKGGIFCGPGRGSAGGSLIAYLLGITSIDPIEHGLLFERFINPARHDLPDIDMDFEDERRREVIDYLVGKYGKDKVCQIATVGKLSGKSVLRDVSRVLGVPLSEVNAVSPSILERPDGHPREYKTVEDSFSEFDACKAFSRRYPKVLQYAMKLEGMAKTLGIHAAGVVVSPVTLTDVIPLEIRKHKGNDVIVSAVDMNEIASVGLVKLDVLGLRTLTVIRDCVNKVKERHGKDLDMERIEMNDRSVLQRFTDHDFSGVFQYDTPSAYKICDGVVFEDFEDIAAMTALNRPGATRSGLSERYLARKKDARKRDKVDFHPIISKICADTLGIIVYQEHVIKIFTEFAGFTPAVADDLRKAIGKKKAEELKAARIGFVKGCHELHGVEAVLAEKIFGAIEQFGAYGFNKSHATAYATIAYWCQWLKHHYVTEFYWALLKNEPERADLKRLAKEAKRTGISVLNPHVSYSRDTFSIDPDGNIRGSLVDIKGVGARAALAVMEQQPFKSFLDFANRVDRRKCNRGVVVTLIQAGAFEGLVPNQRFFERHLEELWKAFTKKRKKREAIYDFWERAKKAREHTPEERMLTAAKVNPLAFGEHPLDAYRAFMTDHVGVPLARMDAAAMQELDGESVYVAGLLVDSRVQQIGDFHTGDLPTELERKRMFWGARYANVNLECDSGIVFRVRFDFDIFEAHHELIEAEPGTPIVAHVTVDAKYNRLRAHFACDLEKLRVAVRARARGKAIENDFWADIVAGNHPSRTYPWATPELAKKRRFNTGILKTGSGVFAGVVTNVRLKYDVNGEQMAFFGLLGERGFVNVIAFASYWRTIREVVRRGKLISMPLTRSDDAERGVAYFFNGGKVRALKKTSASESASETRSA